MKFVKFPNGKVWRVSCNGLMVNWIEGSVLVPDFSEMDNLESKLDALCDAATGSCGGLSNFWYKFRGNDIVEFRGYAEDLPVEEWYYADEGFQLLDTGSSELADALAEQYGLLPREVKHALRNLEKNYGDESVIDVLGSQRQIRSPAKQAECNYVRVVVDGLEIAHWCNDELRDDPSSVMEAFLSAARGGVIV